MHNACAWPALTGELLCLCQRGQERDSRPGAIFLLPQVFYLTAKHRAQLKAKEGIESWHFEQHADEAVFIPGGCPHQVSSLSPSCCPSCPAQVSAHAAGAVHATPARQRCMSKHLRAAAVVNKARKLVTPGPDLQLVRHASILHCGAPLLCFQHCDVAQAVSCAWRPQPCCCCRRT